VPSYTHQLKSLPEFFEAVLDHIKTFEIRKDDRAFKVGDIVTLREWRPLVVGYTGLMAGYTGRELHVKVTYKMAGGLYGLAEGYCIMGIKIIADDLTEHRS
jgi:hypothetical protein